jgi:hypothetical protein
MLVAMFLWTVVSDDWLHSQLSNINQEKNNKSLFLKSE